MSSLPLAVVRTFEPTFITILLMNNQLSKMYEYIYPTYLKDKSGEQRYIIFEYVGYKITAKIQEYNKYA